MRQRLLSVFVLSFALAAAAEAKSLYWKSIDVDARIDREGLLHVVETQAFVFDGDWNGGERTFNIRGGQALKVEGVERIDPSGQAVTEPSNVPSSSTATQSSASRARRPESRRLST